MKIKNIIGSHMCRLTRLPDIIFLLFCLLKRLQTLRDVVISADMIIPSRIFFFILYLCVAVGNSSYHATLSWQFSLIYALGIRIALPITDSQVLFWMHRSAQTSEASALLLNETIISLRNYSYMNTSSTLFGM